MYQGSKGRHFISATRVTEHYGSDFPFGMQKWIRCINDRLVFSKVLCLFVLVKQCVVGRLRLLALSAAVQEKCILPLRTITVH